MKRPGLTEAMRRALERGEYSRAALQAAIDAGFINEDPSAEWLTPRGQAALAAPRVTAAELAVLTYLEEGIGTSPRYSAWLSCERNGWIDFNNGYECWDFTPAGTTALNNIRAASGSPDWREQS
jgi:hypothetical protein